MTGSVLLDVYVIVWVNGRTFYVYKTFHRGKNGVRSGIRTHAPEETGALNQRLRPLGHPNTALCSSTSDYVCGVTGSILGSINLLWGFESLSPALLSPWPSGRASVSGAEDRGFESLRGCFLEEGWLVAISRTPILATSYYSYAIPDSLGGQDTRLSPVRPGFNSRSGNFFV